MMTLAGSSLWADFSYQETSTITGGMMMSMMKVAGVFSKQAREPIQSTIAIKGDKMVHRSATHASVIDLASGTITSIDFQKKTYSVMTFEEMKQFMEQMAEKAQKGGGKSDMKFKVSADATGKSKQIAGLEAKEMIMRMEMEATDEKSGQKGGMTVTTDMWISSGVSGYQEMRDFHKRMAEKLNWNPGGNMFAANPQVSQGMAEVYKEVAKLDGVPVQQFISMGMGGQPGTAGAPAGSGAPPQQQQQPPADKPSVGSALGGALGGRFGLGRKKTTTDKPADQPPAGDGQSQAGPGSLLEMTTEMTGFSNNPVDPSLMAVPAGFKKVDPEMKKMK
jgi:hypothetical protein